MVPVDGGEDVVEEDGDEDEGEVVEVRDEVEEGEVEEVEEEGAEVVEDLDVEVKITDPWGIMYATE